MLAPRRSAFGYPVTTFLVLLGSVGFLVAGVVEDWRSGVMALLFLSLCIPAYALAARSRRAVSPRQAAGICSRPELMLCLARRPCWGRQAGS